MNRRPPTLALFLLISASSFNPVVVSQNKSPKGTPLAASPDLFSVVISTVRPSENVGSGHSVLVTITNISPISITIIDTQPLCDYTVDVLDEAGDVPPMDKLRQQINCEAVDIEISGRRIIRELKPNKSYSDSLILRQSYEMTHPGKYRVQIGRKIPVQLGKGWVKSNMITLTLTE